METDDGYLVPNPEFFENTGDLNGGLASTARLSLSRPNPQEIPTFGPKSEGANALGRALDISELDSTPYATTVANAKPQDKDYKLTDGGGLYLLVRTNGAKLWRLSYRYLGKYRTLASGSYPEVSLA